MIENTILTHIHTTAEGEKMLVAQMGTTHILRTIRLAVIRAYEVVESASQDLDEYTTALYGIRTATPERAANIVRDMLGYIQPYIFEIFFRIGEVTDENLAIYTDIHTKLALILRRTGKLDIDLPLLPSTSSGDPLDYYEWDDEH